MSKKIKEVRVDHASFNADHYDGKTEKQFIEDQIGAVPDHIGDESAKQAWLKEAWTKVNPEASTSKKK